MEKAQLEDAIVTFVAIPAMMLIALYLIACVIAPLINLNTQTFRILFTVTGVVPILVVYQKNQISRRIKRNTITQKQNQN